eukprot:701301-Rhodomonas_salina.1
MGGSSGGAQSQASPRAARCRCHHHMYGRLTLRPCWVSAIKRDARPIKSCVGVFAMTGNRHVSACRLIPGIAFPVVGDHVTEGA